MADLRTANSVPSEKSLKNAREIPDLGQKVLIAEDDEDTRNSLQEMLQLALGVHVETACDGQQALDMLGSQPFSLLITDLRMPRINGMKLIAAIQERQLPVTVIVTTGHGSIQDAVQAMRLGAYDFLTKPPDPQYLCLLVQRALQDRALRDEVLQLRKQLSDRHSFQNILSKNQRMHDIFDLIGHVADTASTVLIEGETGSGKEQVARAVHDASAAHRSGPFVAINCAALPETLLESELFGHEKGAFTGANQQRKGRFEVAHGGTLFLDEVGDVPSAMQIKLLRVLQERRFERIGGTETIDIDIRLIAATNRPLDQMVKQGKFREDLFYRLNVIRIELPPLRDRLEDVPLLVAHFVQKYVRPGQQPCQVDPAAMEVLVNCPWPGNVRQLENAIERACVTARDNIIRPEDLPEDLSRSSHAKGQLKVDISRPLPDLLAEMTAEYEQRYLRKALKKCQGHVGRCATLSGLSRRSITDKIAQYGIDKSAFKQPE